MSHPSRTDGDSQHKHNMLLENYREGGFLQGLEFGQRPALLIVDFVKAYLLEDSPLFGGEGCSSAQRAAIELLQAARTAAMPVLHTRVCFDSQGRNGGIFFRKVAALQCFAANAPNPERAEFGEGLQPLPDEIVITKQYASAFFGTSLAATLTASGIDTLLIAGVSTSGCVRATAVDCCQYGFIPVVVRDAVGDRASGPHEASLFDLQAKYGEVIGLAAALDYVGKVGAVRAADARLLGWNGIESESAAVSSAGELEKS